MVRGKGNGEKRGFTYIDEGWLVSHSYWNISIVTLLGGICECGTWNDTRGVGK